MHRCILCRGAVPLDDVEVEPSDRRNPACVCLRCYLRVVAGQRERGAGW